MAQLPPLGPFGPAQPEVSHAHALAWCGALSVVVGAILIAFAIVLLQIAGAQP